MFFVLLRVDICAYKDMQFTIRFYGYFAKKVTKLKKQRLCGIIRNVICVLSKDFIDWT